MSIAAYQLKMEVLGCLLELSDVIRLQHRYAGPILAFVKANGFDYGQDTGV